MDITIAFLAAVLAAGLSYATLNRSVCNAVKVLRPADPEAEYASIPLSKAGIGLLVAFVAVTSFAAGYRIMQLTSSWIGICKMLIALLCMTGAACVDFREKRIPNIFPLIMAASGLLLLAAGVVLNQKGAIAYVTSSFISCAACTIFLMVASALTKHGIGAGDIKLIGALALIGGTVAVMGTIFYGVFICGIVAVVALLSKKMSLSNALPFGPFLFIGFIVTVLTGNF